MPLAAKYSCTPFSTNRVSQQYLDPTTRLHISRPTSARWYGRQHRLLTVGRQLIPGTQLLLPAWYVALWRVVKSHGLCRDVYTAMWRPRGQSVYIRHTLRAACLSTTCYLHNHSLELIIRQHGGLLLVKCPSLISTIIATTTWYHQSKLTTPNHSYFSALVLSVIGNQKKNAACKNSCSNNSQKSTEGDPVKYAITRKK